MRQPEPGASPHREAAEPACREARASRRLRGLWFDGVWPQGVAQHVGAFVWLGFILFPAINAFAKHGTALHHGLTIAAAAVFVTLYIALVMLWRARGADRALPVMFVGLVAIAIALTLADANGWGFLFTYCAACAGMMSRRFGFIGVLACAVLAGVSSAAGGATGGQVIGWVASSAGIGMLVLVMGDLRLRNEQLSAARAEMARMAVAQERERFARDLHDLLGHSLSVIALKAELAGRVLTEGARADASGAGAGDGSARERRSEAIAIEADMLERAATEVRELEQVARTALGEVREAVSGYRQPTLAGELAGARMALSAAGIEAEVQQTQVSLDPGVEAVLAWTVREGATNVIRHSGARHCTLRITASLTDAGVEVIDDGVGDSSREGRAGAPPASRVGAPGAGRLGARGCGPRRRRGPRRRCQRRRAHRRGGCRAGRRYGQRSQRPRPRRAGRRNGQWNQRPRPRRPC
ncbi:MAG: hypothetical protein JO262_06895 [Solirubrobacterales bacterium]|nr:hypothetical protein [Solirubrobacterales bacterium]